MSRHHTRINPARWRAARRAVFDRDGWRCVQCGRAGRLECDHIVPFQWEPDQAPYALDGLQTLCKRCHVQKTRCENLNPDRLEWVDYLDYLLRKHDAQYGASN